MTRRLRVVVRIVLVPLAIAAAIWVFASLDPRKAWRIAREADAYWLAASVAPLILRFVLWGVKTGSMLRRETPMTTADATRSILAGAFLNLVTPTAKLAGGVFRAASLRRRTGWRFSRAHGWIVADQVTNGLGSLALFGVLAIAASPAVGDPTLESWVRGVGIASLTFVLSFAIGRRTLWALFHHPFVRRSLSRWRPVWTSRSPDDPDPRAWYDVWLAPTLEGRGGAGALAVDLTLAAASWGMLCLGNALVFRAIGVDASIPLLATVLVIGVFAGSLVGMGGVGVTEAALVGLYTQIGISGPEAAAGALLHRVSYYAIILVWGAIAFVKCNSDARASRTPDVTDATPDSTFPDPSENDSRRTVRQRP